MIFKRNDAPIYCYLFVCILYIEFFSTFSKPKGARSILIHFSVQIVKMDENEKRFNRKGVQKIHHPYQDTTKIQKLNILIYSKTLSQRIKKELSTLIKNQKIQVDHIKSMCYTTKLMCLLTMAKTSSCFFPLSFPNQTKSG